MQLNAESHFAQTPLAVDKPRSTFDRSCNWKGTGSAGMLNPFFVDEILPGDTVDMKTIALTRMTTPIYPVMDDCFLDQFFFFVPMRLVWDHAKDFFGENRSSAWASDYQYTIPTLNLDYTTRKVGDLAHMMGLPYQTFSSYSEVNSLPFRSYRLIWNEWFRDQNTQDPKLINFGDSDDDTSLIDLLPVNRIKDYFGTALPNTQKGEAVKIALEGLAPVYASKTETLPGLGVASSTVGSVRFAKSWSRDGSISDAPSGSLEINSGLLRNDEDGATASNFATPVNLIADMDNETIGLDVRTLRLAVQTQRVLEALSMGSRYVEFVRTMFGVTSPDARQQRPELIGYSRTRLNMYEVTQNNAAIEGEAMTPLGTIGAFSKTLDDRCKFTHSFTEHGYLIGLWCVRHNRSYSQGIEKMWSRRTMFDFYMPQFAHISEQPIFKKEIYAAAPDDEGEIFGYNEAYAEYRYKPSHNVAYMDPSVSGSLGRVWTYGDVYADVPTLSDTWMQEGNAEVKRTLAVEDAPEIMLDAWFDFKHSRVMPVYSVPGLVDHF